MPVPFLIALVLAFGMSQDGDGRILPASDLPPRLLALAIVLGLIGLLSWSLGVLLARSARSGLGTPVRWRRLLHLCGRMLDLLVVALYGLVLFGIEWPRVVTQGFGLGDAILIDEVLVLLPYLVAQVLVWWGLAPAELLLRPARRDAVSRPSLAGHLWRKLRPTIGMVLPALLIYTLGRDLAGKFWPAARTHPSLQLAGMALLGGLFLSLSPMFVRLSWPTRPLPPGPLRTRLERLSARLGFRFTDVLVWDTDGTIVNAGVTGALPWFRYILLTDALIESLEPCQIEAVFGHEVGHVRHRHLAYFGFFFVGSLGVLALIGQGFDWMLQSIPWRPSQLDADLASALELGIALVTLLLYFLLVFGYLSRRFERQADVFGCRVVSCQRPDCPPHPDVNAQPGVPPLPPVVCAVGIRIFASALSAVASLNGMEPSARSWRHGSIRRRIAFLEGLEGRPDAERRFEARIHMLRLGMATCLVAALVLAAATGALDQF